MSDFGGIPIDVIHAWPDPNYVDPKQRGWGIVVMCAILYVLAILVVSLRLFARFVKLKSHGIDDYLIAASMVPLLGLNISVCLGVKMFHFDRHLWDVPPQAIPSIRKIFIPIDLLLVISTGLVKLAVLFLYRRLTTGTFTPAIKWTFRICIASVILYIVGFTVSTFTSCVPFHAFWDSYNPEWNAVNGRDTWWCANKKTMYVSNVTISIVQDFIACTMPLLVVRKLQLSSPDKLALRAIFVAGYCLCITSIIRIVMIVRVFEDELHDFTWAAHSTFVMSAVDANLAVILASLPGLRVYFRHWPVPSRFARLDANKSRVSPNRYGWPGVRLRSGSRSQEQYPLQNTYLPTAKSYHSETTLVTRLGGER